MKPPLLWLATLLLLMSAAQAQTAHGRVRILVYGARTVGECAAPVKALQAELATLQFPAGWTMGIVCNPLAWEQILRIADPPQTDSAFSNLLRHSTVLNAAIFSGSRRMYRHTLVHELGHAICMCGSEQRAEDFAAKHEEDVQTAKAVVK